MLRLPNRFMLEYVMQITLDIPNQYLINQSAFGQLQGLSEQQTLACFGEHYRKVLATPGETDHANIRTFMRHGWAGIRFDGAALQAKT